MTGSDKACTIGMGVPVTGPAWPALARFRSAKSRLIRQRGPPGEKVAAAVSNCAVADPLAAGSLAVVPVPVATDCQPAGTSIVHLFRSGVKQRPLAEGPLRVRYHAAALAGAWTGVSLSTYQQI